jgi:hypothetical protein
MSAPGRRTGSRTRRARPGRWLAAALLAAVPAAGCEDRPFEPYAPNETAAFSMYGYLDVKADTQWVRVMPVRQNLLSDPAPIDAVVTLEDVETGHTVTLKDSTFRYADAQLDGVVYAHNFWTTERLAAGARYRLRAVRSDGDSTTAVVNMPADFEFSFLNLEGGGDTALVQLRAERVLSVETLHTMATGAGEPGGRVAKRQKAPSASGNPGVQLLYVDGTPAIQSGLSDVGRTDLRIAVAGPDWQFDATLPDLEVMEPSTMPSNVEHGLGYVGGVEIWTIPFHRCGVLADRPGGQSACEIHYDARAASIAGRVVRQPCGDPHALAPVRLVERFADGGAVVLTWKTGWDGEYRFEGIEPGADLVVQLDDGATAVTMPRLGPGQRYVVPDISVPDHC